MGFKDAIGGIDWGTVGLIIIAFIPYVDSETIGVVPGLRDLFPFVEPIPVTDLSWTERLRLGVLILIPVVDGEILQILGVEIEDVYSD